MGAERFKFKFTVDQIRILLKGNKEADAWYDAMVEILPLWDINTIERVAGFLAQTQHESLNYTVLSENLNYSADGLLKTFPKYFGPGKKDPNAYARQPEKIANYVYANRMGNGPESSGDGWKHRGRGVIQLTGTDNYTAFAKVVKMSVADAINYVQTKKGAIDSACWFWDTRNINKTCDAKDIVAMTKLVNGGTNGLDDRTTKWNKALSVLGSDVKAESTTPTAPTSTSSYTTLRKGSKGLEVVKLQTALGIPADGDYGSGTEAAVKKYQASKGLTADGIAGPATQKSLGL